MKGFSLVELMIALGLGVMLSLLMTNVYWTYARNFDAQKNYMQATEAATLATFYLREIIEEAGYIGCLSLSNARIINHTNHSIEPFQISDDAGSIEINALSKPINYLLEDNHSSHYLLVNSDPVFHSGDTLMISNCSQVEIFTISEVSKKGAGQLLYSLKNLSAYHAGDYVGLWLSSRLFTGKTSRKTFKGQPVYALYLVQNNRKEELIENITALQFKTFTTKSQDFMRVRVSFQETGTLKNWAFDEYLKK